VRAIWRLLWDAWNDCLSDRIARLGAALAFYMIFSLAPLVVIAVAIAG
jgi:membrane protein